MQRLREAQLQREWSKCVYKIATVYSCLRRQKSSSSTALFSRIRQSAFYDYALPWSGGAAVRCSC